MLLLTVPLLAALTGAAPTDLAPQAKVTATSAASDKYAAAKATAGDPNAHWASADAKLPQALTLTWRAPVKLDTVLLAPYAPEADTLYPKWQAVELEAAGQVCAAEWPDGAPDVVVVRFPQPVETQQLVVRLTRVVAPKTYVGLSAVRVYLDPQHVIQPPPSVPHAKPFAALTPQGRPQHPCVYVTTEDVERARRNAKETAWGKRVAAQLVTKADEWLKRSDAEWRAFLPPPGACYAYGFTGSPINGASWGTWGGARCSWDNPGHVTTNDGHVFPDAAHPDDGTGYHGPDGRIHYFVGSWNAWVTEQWTNAIDQLADAYAITGDERYADRAALFLDLLGSIYPESSSGSWDYPSSPPSGRFARPWYQVARTLVRYVEAYDLIYASKVLDRPSLRPELEQTFPKGPTLQQQAVGTEDRHGVSQPGMTRRQNIDRNFIADGAYYCYEHTFSGMLHNGHADYMRGALAGGALLGIPEYVYNAWSGPYSIWAMIANNADRDGRYYETSLMYAIHARELYLTYIHPLLNWRDAQHPQGLELCADPRFRSFYRLPALSVACAGHAPNFGDSGPDNAQIVPSDHPFSQDDYLLAEELYSGSRGVDKDEFGRILRWLGRGNVDRLRQASAGRWMLYHAEPVPAGPADLPAPLQRNVFGSWFLGQKGVAILRDGERANAQAAFLRYGPSLNHGHQDDLNLNYYAAGWQMTYDIGYGLGSTHTQVGWAHQTASHSLVTVNAQSQDGPGSGGSLYLFGRLPGLRVVEADAPMAYGKQGVTEYRRTVAMLGEGREQVLVDLFRVTGGHQHDYLVGGQGQDLAVAGVQLPPPGSGSLAAGVDWGRKQGNDGDLIGVPNKPYWNPPPGSGYGFFYDPQRAKTDAPWSLTWKLGGDNEAHFQVTFLPEAGSEAIVAKAPGLYPQNAKASYGIVRREGADGLRSAFASVMAPYQRPLVGTIYNADELAEMIVDERGSHAVGADYGGYLLLRATQPGDGATFALAVPRDGEYQVVAQMLQYPSYGQVKLLLDGRPVGQVVDLKAPAAKAKVPYDLGTHTLTAGTHRLTVQSANDTTRLFSLQTLVLRTAGEAQPTAAAPVVTLAERLPVQGGGAETPVAVHLRRAGRDEYLLSAGIDGTERIVATPHGELRWRGGVAYVAFAGGRVVAAGTVGCAGLTGPGLSMVPQSAAFTAHLTATDEAKHYVDLDAPLPATGLEGEAAVFSRPEWTRTSAYRIERIEPLAAGCRLHLGNQSMLLGRGHVMSITDGHRFVSDIPHEYNQTKQAGGHSGFFDGKLLVTDGGKSTRIKTMDFGQPMPVDVADTSILNVNEGVSYMDLGPGDTLTVPTSTWLALGDGGWTVETTAAASVNVAGTNTTVPATGAGQGKPL